MNSLGEQSTQGLPGPCLNPAWGPPRGRTDARAASTCLPWPRGPAREVTCSAAVPDMQPVPCPAGQTLPGSGVGTPGWGALPRATWLREALQSRPTETEASSANHRAHTAPQGSSATISITTPLGASPAAAIVLRTRGSEPSVSGSDARTEPSVSRAGGGTHTKSRVSWCLCSESSDGPCQPVRLCLLLGFKTTLSVRFC